MATKSGGYTSSGRAGKRSDAALVVLLTLLALLLRAARLDFQPLWWDEGYSVWFAHHSLATMARLTALDIHPPLYYALLGGWGQILGFEPLALRWFSVLIGSATVPLMFVAGDWLSSRRTGLVAAALLAINPLHIYYSQEVRMYALVTLWALPALMMAARWLGLGQRIARAAAPTDQRLLIGYVAAITLALYTQYYAGFLLVGIALTGGLILRKQRAERAVLLRWLAAQAAALLLFLPWLLYAGPKLLPYISQKVVADSDPPLELLLYLARHLAAFGTGHLEGALADWWPLGLIGVILLLAGLLRLLQRRAAPPQQIRLLVYLGVILTTVLLLGWLVNLSYPFFPERGERLLLLGLPVFLLLLAAVWEYPDPVRSPHQQVVLQPLGSGVTGYFTAGMLLLSLLALVPFYTVPRYAEEDYRPLIGQVTQWARPEDTVFAIYPWQVGYFWSYAPDNGPRALLSPSDEWGPELSTTLDAALQRGRVWFPMHLALGGKLETTVEQYLAASNAQLTNRWYSSSTRLTGWGVSNATEAPTRTATAHFDDGSVVSISYQPRPVTAANDMLPLTIAFDTLPGQRLASLRLMSNDERIWAQRDLTIDSPGTQQIAMLIPAGLPAGVYALQFSLAQPDNARAIGLQEPAAQNGQLALGQISVAAPQQQPSLSALPMEVQRRVDLGSNARLLGYSVTAGRLLPGDDLLVNLFWQGLTEVGQDDLSAFVQLLDENDAVAVAWEGPPVAWHLTNTWQPGELVRSQHTLRLPATIEPGRYTLVAGLFNPASGERLPAAWNSGPWGLIKHHAEEANLGTVRIAKHKTPAAVPEPRVRTDAVMTRLGMLVGYDLTKTRLQPGDTLNLTLYWQPRESTGERLTVFVHLVDEQGVIMGQSDSQPAQGTRPTSSWLPNETIADQHSLRVSDDALLGRAFLRVGLYDPATGERVLWLDPTGQPGANALPLPAAIWITTAR